jgi:hypothetical protein
LDLLPNKYKEFQSDKLLEFFSSGLAGQENILIGELQKVKSKLELGIGLVLHGGWMLS